MSSFFIWSFPCCFVHFWIFSGSPVVADQYDTTRFEVGSYGTSWYVELVGFWLVRAILHRLLTGGYAGSLTNEQRYKLYVHCGFYNSSPRRMPLAATSETSVWSHRLFVAISAQRDKCTLRQYTKFTLWTQASENSVTQFSHTVQLHDSASESSVTQFNQWKFSHSAATKFSHSVQASSSFCELSGQFIGPHNFRYKFTSLHLIFKFSLSLKSELLTQKFGAHQHRVIFFKNFLFDCYKGVLPVRFF